MIRMEYNPQDVSRLTRILFPIIITVIAALIAPQGGFTDRLFDVRQPDP